MRNKLLNNLFLLMCVLGFVLVGMWMYRGMKTLSLNNDAMEFQTRLAMDKDTTWEYIKMCQIAPAPFTTGSSVYLLVDTEHKKEYIVVVGGSGGVCITERK